MSTDAGLHAGSSWSLVERGSFVLGRCTTCGFASPARRARFSAESDMRAHEVLCEAVRAGARTRQVADRLVGEVASGRERLSAQGRS